MQMLNTRRRTGGLLAALAVLITPLAAATVMTAAPASATSAPHVTVSHVTVSHRPVVVHRAVPMCPTRGRCCLIDNDGDCTVTVTGTAEGIGGVNIRSGPGTGYSIVGSMANQSTGTVDCYKTGTNINGDSYWDDITTIQGGHFYSGFVSDYYLYTGGNINQQVDPC